jgi:hypothetical protein
MEQKTEVPGIYKVSEGVLINKDEEGLRAYKMKKEKDRRLQRLEEDFNSVRNDLNEIKELLRGLVK